MSVTFISKWRYTQFTIIWSNTACIQKRAAGVMRLNTQGPMKHEGSFVASGDVCLFACFLILRLETLLLCMAQTGLELITTLIAHPPTFKDHRCVPSCPALMLTSAFLKKPWLPLLFEVNLPRTSKASLSEPGFLGPTERRKTELFLSDLVPNAVGGLADLVLTANLCCQTRVQSMSDPAPNPAGKTTIPHFRPRIPANTLTLRWAAAPGALVTLKVSDWREPLSTPTDSPGAAPAGVNSTGLQASKHTGTARLARRLWLSRFREGSGAPHGKQTLQWHLCFESVTHT